MVSQVFLKNLTVNTEALNAQSRYIASQTPVTPISKITPNMKLKPTRKTHIDITDKIIGNFTSLAARKEWGVVKDNGQIVQTAILFINIIVLASSDDFPERL